MKKSLLLLLFVCLSCTHKKKSSINEIGTNSTYKNKVKDKDDDAVLKLNSKKYDTVVRNQYSQLTDLYLANQKYQKLKEVSQIIEHKSTIVKDTFGIIRAKVNLGAYYINYYTNDSAFYYFTQAEKLSKKLKGKPFLCSILYNKATLLWFQKDYKGSEKTGVEALKLALEKKDNTLIYSGYIVIANSLVGMDDDTRALKYYNEALSLVDELRNEPQYLTFKAQVYNYIAKVYQKQNQYQKALNYVKDNLDLNEIKRENNALYCYLINNMAYSKFKLGDKSSYNQFVETLDIAKKINNVSIQLTSKMYLGEYYLTQHDTLKANYYLKDGWLQAHNNKIFEDELKLLQLLIQANPNNSSIYSKKYISLNDSLQSIERSARDKFARIEFETDEITKKKTVAENQNTKLINRIWLITGVGLLSLLVIVLWFMNKSQKAKTRELLLKQQQQNAKEEIYQLMLNQQQKIEEGKQIEKRRISQELHDGIMGRLSSIRMNLFILNKKTDAETIKKCLEYIKDIQSIEKEIRKIAHDLNKDLFSDSANFNSIVENLFTSIKSHNDIDFVLITDERIDWETVNNDVKINVFRIIQEALQNIDKYAQANKVSITMSKKEETINIEIKDDGIGFDVNSFKNGIGIKNMQQRIEDCNGRFEIESVTKKGTKINLTIPI